MTLTGGYGPVDPAQAAAVLGQALRCGVDLIDTADAYVGGEELVAATLAANPEHPVKVVTKIGLTGPPGERQVNGRPTYLKRACDASLRRLGRERLDILLLHRVDPEVPVEEACLEMTEMVRAGKVEAIGLCTSNPNALRRAAATGPVTYVQTPLSVLAPLAADVLLTTARDLGVTMLASSPLGRGLVPADLDPSTLPLQDARAHIPEIDPIRRSRAAAFRQIATGFDVSSVEMALGWIASLGQDVIAIPGVRTTSHVIGNLKAQREKLAPEQLLAVDAFVSETGVNISR